MMWIIASSLALLSVAAGMALLAKTKKDELGKYFRWVSYLIVVAGFLGFACAVSHGICRMGCKSKCTKDKMECSMDGGMMKCGPGMMGGMNHGGSMGDHRMSGCGGGKNSGACCGMCANGQMMNDDCCKKGGKRHGCSMDDDDKEVEIEIDTIVIKKK